KLPPMPFENIVSERLVERDYGHITGGGKAEIAVPKALVERTRTMKMVEDGVLKRSDLNATYPFRWLVLNRFESTYKLPDFIVSLEHLRKGNSPVSIAVEVELSAKAPRELKNILETYKFGLKEEYGLLIYFVTNNTVKNLLIRAADEADFPKNRLMIL